MKIVFRLILIILLTVGIIRTDAIFLKKPIFEVKEITILGARPRILKALEPLKKEIILKNINDLNFREIENRILKDVRIKNASIKTEGVDKLIIKIEEKNPKCYVQYRNEIYMIDENGIIFNFYEDDSPKDFPFLVVNERMLKKLNVDSQIVILSEVLDKILNSNFRDTVSQIYIKDSSLIIVVLNNGTIIKTNTKVATKKYEVASSLFSEIRKEQKIQYMDLRYNDYIVKYMVDKNGR